MFTSRYHRTLQIKIQQRYELIEELIQYKKIFTYKRLEECEEFLSKYISEHKKAPVSLPEMAVGDESAQEAKDIISCVRKMGQTEFESVVNALKEIKKIAKKHNERGQRIKSKKGELFCSRLKDYFKKIFEKFNILIDEENEFSKIERLINHEKERSVCQRLSLTP